MLKNGYRYVTPRKLNSDPIKRKFGFYRDGTDSNNPMFLINVKASFKKSLTQFGVQFLDEIDSFSRIVNHSSADFDELIQKFELDLIESITGNEAQLHVCVTSTLDGLKHGSFCSL